MSYVSRDLFLMNIDKLAASALAGAEEFGRGVGEYWGNQAQSVADSISQGAARGKAKRSQIKQMAAANRAGRPRNTDPLGGEYAVNLTNGARNAANKGIGAVAHGMDALNSGITGGLNAAGRGIASAGRAVSDWGDRTGRKISQARNDVSNAAYGGLNAARESVNNAANNIASSWNRGADRRAEVQAAANANRATRATDRTPLGGTYAEAITDGVRNAGRSIGNWFSGIGAAWNRGAEKRNAALGKGKGKGNGANGKYYAGL